MSLTSIGDLSHHLMLQTQTTRAKRALSTLTQELSSGVTSNISDRLGGDFAYLSDIDHKLKRLEGISTSAGEAKLVATTMQTSLESVYDATQTMVGAFLAVGQSTSGPSLPHLSASAEQQLGSVIQMLNMSVGGRSLFAGAATDAVPLEEADTLLTALQAELVGSVTAADVITAAEDWFNDPAGFDAVMYGGSANSVAPLRIGEGVEVSLDLRADDQTFKDMLRNIAVAALVTDPGLGLATSVQSELVQASRDGLMAVSDQLTGMRADVGFAEERIEESQARNGAASNSLQQARTELLEADPFDIANRIQNVQFRLESLYSVTARSAGLTLVNFL
ncbi:flagellin [Chachezhania antarctica]|uniref:flagellin N-terminal helical domain-containing protein n=1 Tax=Chachezhania antarctica TaxID=2340860 RepID=UPI000EB2FC03|nr:flagellin [Chachezhania antarctica]|tara:strand:+ start:15172 stop:16176 length:1005 start_codon:yes stop_codon:yes gene_type:complete